MPITPKNPIVDPGQEAVDQKTYDREWVYNLSIVVSHSLPEVQAMDAAVQEAKDDFTAHEGKIAKARQNLEAAGTAVKAKRGQLDLKQQEIKDAISEDPDADVSALQAQSRGLEAELETFEADEVKLRGQLELLEADLDGFRDTVTDLELVRRRVKSRVNIETVPMNSVTGEIRRDQHRGDLGHQILTDDFWDLIMKVPEFATAVDAVLNAIPATQEYVENV